MELDADDEHDSRIQITVLGDGGCGKSSITLRLVRSQWTQDYDPTIEDSYTITRHVDGRAHLLTLTDTAGQEEYRALWTTATLAADAFLLVYDITSAASLARLAPFCALVDHEAADRADRAAVQPVRIVAGNKCDLQHARQVRAAEGLAWARARGCGFMETSARDMVNVEETFALIVRRVVEARKAHAEAGAAAAGHASAVTRPLSPMTAAEKRGANAAAAAGTRRARWRRVWCC